MAEPLRLRLKGLDCASCAARIEQALQQEGFADAAVNFVRREAVLTGDADRAGAIIRRIEPGVRVVPVVAGEKDDPDRPHRIPAAMLAAVALFAAALAARYGPWGVGRAADPLFVAAYLLAGRKVLRLGLLGPLRGKLLDENFLMTVATAGAFAIGEFPEAAGVMVFFMVGEFFQDLAVDRSRRSIRSLLSLKADVAHRLDGLRMQDVDPAGLVPGDRIVVRPGERVPVDGVVASGSASVDLSALTGESMPRSVAEGDEILSGALCRDGLLTIRVARPLEESTVARILSLVEDATARKARTERFITRFARVYTPVVVGLALLVAVVPPLVYGAPFSRWLYRALVLLVISCPCALVLSIPLGYFAGLGRAAARGILVKGSSFLDALARPAVVAFDKTGTLTRGEPRVVETVTRNGFSESELVALAALAEAHSSHPVAVAVREAHGAPVDPAAVSAVEEVAGAGVVAHAGGREILVGNDRLLHRHDIDHDTCDVAGTVVHVAVDGLYAGYLVLADELKEDAAAAVRALKRLGVGKVVMVTGDDRGVAEAVARQAGVDEVHAELLPADKVAVIERLAREVDGAGTVVFVGDGINDAPVLARADVGIAMGALGSDAAVETADVVLMDDRPMQVAEGIGLARATGRIVRQNIALALGVKVLFIGLGISGEATMWEAVFADVGVALLAVGNALRIMRVGPRGGGGTRRD